MKSIARIFGVLALVAGTALGQFKTAVVRNDDYTIVDWSLIAAANNIAGTTNLFAGAGTTGLVSSAAGDAGNFLRADGTWQSFVAGDVFAASNNVFTGNNIFTSTNYLREDLIWRSAGPFVSNAGRIEPDMTANALYLYDGASRLAFSFSSGLSSSRRLYDTRGNTILEFTSSTPKPILKDDGGLWESEGTAVSGDDIVNYTTMASWVNGGSSDAALKSAYNVFATSNRFNGNIRIDGTTIELANSGGGGAFIEGDEIGTLFFKDYDGNTMLAMGGGVTAEQREFYDRFGNTLMRMQPGAGGPFPVNILSDDSGSIWGSEGTATNGIEIVNWFCMTNHIGSGIAYDVIPAASNQYALGSAALPWSDIFVSEGSVYIGELKLSDDGSGGLAVQSGTNTPATVGDVVASAYNVFATSNRFDGAFYDSSDYKQMDLTAGKLYNEAEYGANKYSVDWVNRILADDSVTTLDWGQGILSSVFGQPWTVGGLADTGNEIVNYAAMTNYVLGDIVGTDGYKRFNITLGRYYNEQEYGAGIYTVDLLTQTFYDGSGNQASDYTMAWAGRTLYGQWYLDTDATMGQQVVNYQTMAGYVSAVVSGMSVTNSWLDGNSVTNEQVFLSGLLQTWTTNGVSIQ